MNEVHQSAEELLEKIFYYMTELLRVKEFSETVTLLTDMGSSIVNSDRASFWFWDKENKTCWTLAAKDNEKIVIPENTGMVGKTMTSGEVILCNAPYESEDFNPSVDKRTGYVTKSILCVPVKKSNGTVIGAFQVINKLDLAGNDVPFDETDVSRMSLVTAFCEKTLESYMLQSEAMVDALTGLKNRHAFYEYYNTKVVNMIAHKEISIVMCDIDHFKHVNDTYGHNSGDIVLKEVSKIFTNNARVDDVVVRWGGEEFIFILIGMNIGETRNFAERIRTRVEEHPFELEQETIHVTMSFGVSEIEASLSAEENVKKADDRLYEAKNTGRNKVV